MIQHQIQRWQRFVTGVRFALAVLFLPVMFFGFIAFPEGRIVTATAIVLLSAIIVLHLRSRRVAEADQPKEPANEAGGPFQKFVTEVKNLRRINVAIIVSQLVGALLGWVFSPSRDPLDALRGGALASPVGLFIGWYLDRSRSRLWAQSEGSTRLLYVVCAVSISVFGGVLLFVG